MEYRRAYRDEQPDGYLIGRHELEVFPLLRRRYLFGQAGDFLLYDFQPAGGPVNEDVFAYSNRVGQERALVVYHNRYAEARGYIHTSAAYSAPAEQGDGRALVQQSLGQGLSLHDEENAFTIFRDHVSGLEYIRNSQALCREGLYVDLGAYKVHVFLDWREVWDDERHLYSDLAAYLNGRGAPSIEEAVQDMLLRPVHQPFRELVNAEMFRRLIDARVTVVGGEPDVRLLGHVERMAIALLNAVTQMAHGTGDEAGVAREIRHNLEAIQRLPVAESVLPLLGSAEYWWAGQQIQESLDDDAAWGLLLGWLFTHALGQAVGAEDRAMMARNLLDEWRLNRILADALRGLGLDERDVRQSVAAVRILAGYRQWFQPADTGSNTACGVFESWLKDGDAAQFLGVNRHEGVLWFHKESFGKLLRWTLLVATVEAVADVERPAEEIVGELAECYDALQSLQRAEEQSDYQVEKLLAAARE
jgi:hypothetical protein